MFFQILQHSINYLIGTSKTNASITKSCHKFGFSNPEEFESAIKFISNLYRQFTLEIISEQQLLSHFAHFNQDFQQSVLDVAKTRSFEIQEFLVNEYNSQKNDLLQSFDWDLRWILGTSSLTSLRTQIATLVLNCRNSQLKDLNVSYGIEQGYGRYID